MKPYDEWLYKLKPKYECEPGWWKLAWRPIKNGTWNVYRSRGSKRNWTCGVRLYRGGAHNGWGRSWDTVSLKIDFGRLGGFEAWITWNIRVMAEGPLDTATKRPLEIPK